jgi:hypothetical protein
LRRRGRGVSSTFTTRWRTGSSYAAQLKELSVETELTAEALKLSFIRARKGRRFKYALWATTAFYALVFIAFLVLRRCS